MVKKEETTKKTKAAVKPKVSAKSPKDSTKKIGSSTALRKKSESTDSVEKISMKNLVSPAISIQTEIQITKPTISGKEYVFATGRRKTAVANIRLSEGSGDSQVNKKKFSEYFANVLFQEEALKPLSLSGLLKDFRFSATVNGGGAHAQAQAVRHGIAQALGSLSDELRQVMKKNGFLTRDDRKKERKKPGLRGARRSPQWAKR